MNINDFHIGLTFTNATGVDWRCTDVGSRAILAIEIDPERDPTWFAGPPYVVEEVVFDERAISGCFTSLENALIERTADSYHPGYSMGVVKKMMGAKRASYQAYPNKRVLRYDRVNKDGMIAHPYTAEHVDGAWVVHVYYVYTDEFDVVPEYDFITWRAATEHDYRHAHEALASK